MNQFNFGELNGYNEALKYSFEILDFIKEMREKKYDLNKIKHLADPKYEFASAKMHCALQTLEFFQTYEVQGKKINIDDMRIDLIIDLLEQFTIYGKSEITVVEKERAFRNCLAHGRYTLEMNEKGKLDVVFNDPSTNVTGKIPYSDFRNLADIYIRAFNREEIKVVSDTSYEPPRSFKNFSQSKIYSTFFKTLKIEHQEEDRDFNTEKEFERALKEYCNDKESDVKYKTFKKTTVDLLKSFHDDITITSRPLNDEEKQFLKNYMDFSGRKRFNTRFNQQQIRARKRNGIGNILRKDSSRFLELALDLRDTYDYNEFISTALRSNNERIISSSANNRYCLADFISTIDHLNELGSTEKASTKKFDEYMNNTLGRMYGIDLEKMPFINRDASLKNLMENYAVITPTLYTNMQILMTYFAIGYTKEVNSNYGNRIFDFKNIDLKGLYPTFDDTNRPSVKIVDLYENAERKLNRTKTEKRDAIIRRIKRDIDFRNKKGENIFDSIRSRMLIEGATSLEEYSAIDEIKQYLENSFIELDAESDSEKNQEYLLQNNGDTIKAKLIEYIEFFQCSNYFKTNFKFFKTVQDIEKRLADTVDKVEKLKETKEEILRLESETSALKSTTPYEDSSMFFGHIRNSITHSWFDIDYDSMFTAGNFDEVHYHFEDFDIDDKTKTKRKTFEIDLTGADLIYLIEAIQTRLNDAVKDSVDFDVNNIHLNDIRDEIGIIRYDNTKYDSASYPIIPTKQVKNRPTNKDFEETVDEDTLMAGFDNKILDELKKTKDKGEREK